MTLDYRQIPREQLISNIPKGRGMIKWRPFATMPEQYEAVDRLIIEQSMIDPPKLTNNQIQYNERIAQELIQSEAIIRYWSEGQELMIECRIEEIDSMKKTLLVSKDTEIFSIFFYHIYEISVGGYLSDLGDEYYA